MKCYIVKWRNRLLYQSNDNMNRPEWCADIKEARRFVGTAMPCQELHEKLWVEADSEGELSIVKEQL